jgi:hypothetical protein
MRFGVYGKIQNPKNRSDRTFVDCLMRISFDFRVNFRILLYHYEYREGNWGFCLLKCLRPDMDGLEAYIGIFRGSSLNL